MRFFALAENLKDLFLKKGQKPSILGVPRPQKTFSTSVREKDSDASNVLVGDLVVDILRPIFETQF